MVNIDLLDAKLRSKRIQEIAEVCHEVNRAYCEAIGESGRNLSHWSEAPEWQRSSAISGVELHLKNPKTTPMESHAAWLLHKIKNGWKYGPVKDVEKKLHPCCVAYETLPLEQKAKDYIFRQIVHSLANRQT